MIASFFYDILITHFLIKISWTLPEKIRDIGIFRKSLLQNADYQPEYKKLRIQPSECRSQTQPNLLNKSNKMSVSIKYK